MQFQITTDYAIRIIHYLHQQNRLSTAISASQDLGISYQYYAKVINRLKQAKLVDSVQGRNGGYQLARPANEISLYDIICAMEGDVKINRCLVDGFCSRNATDNCPVHDIFADLQQKFVKELSNHFVSEL